jgi:hypothetical protein
MSIEAQPGIYFAFLFGFICFVCDLRQLPSSKCLLKTTKTYVEPPVELSSLVHLMITPPSKSNVTTGGWYVRRQQQARDAALFAKNTTPQRLSESNLDDFGIIFVIVIVIVMN